MWSPLAMQNEPRWKMVCEVVKILSLKGPRTLILTNFSFRSHLWYIPSTKYFNTVNTGIYPMLSNNFIFFKCLRCLTIAKQDQYVTAEWAREITAIAAGSRMFWPRVFLEPGSSWHHNKTGLPLLLIQYLESWKWQLEYGHTSTSQLQTSILASTGRVQVTKKWTGAD